MIEIKNKNTGEIIYTSNADSLIGADLRGVNLFEADLRNFNLQKVIFQNVDLQYSNLHYYNLRGANLREVDLEGANLEESNLQLANLGGSNLQKANLQKANLQYSYLERTNFREADLRNIIVNWYSNTLLSEILFQISETDQQKELCEIINELIIFDWDDFIKNDYPEKEWALEVLVGWIQNDDNHPEILNEYIQINKRGRIN